MLARPKTQIILTTQKIFKSLFVCCVLICFVHQPEQCNAFSFGGKAVVDTPNYGSLPEPPTDIYRPNDYGIDLPHIKPSNNLFVWQNVDPSNSLLTEIDNTNAQKQKAYDQQLENASQNVVDSYKNKEEITYFGENEGYNNKLCKVELFHDAAPGPVSAPAAAKPHAFNAKWTSKPRTSQPTVSTSPLASATGTSNTLSTVSPTVTPSPSVPGVGLWMFRALNSKASPTEEIITNDRQKTPKDERYLRKSHKTDFANPVQMQSHFYFSSCPTNYSGIETSQTESQHRLCDSGFQNFNQSSINITADHNYEILVKASSTEDDIKSIVDKLEISMGEEVTARLLNCDTYKNSSDLFYTLGTISKYDLTPSDSVSSTHCNQLNRHARDSRCFVIQSSSTVYYNPDASRWYGMGDIFPFTKAEDEIKNVIIETIGDGCTNGIFNASGIFQCQIFDEKASGNSTSISPETNETSAVGNSSLTDNELGKGNDVVSDDDETSEPSPEAISRNDANVTGTINKLSPIHSLWPLAFLFAVVVFVFAVKKHFYTHF